MDPPLEIFLFVQTSCNGCDTCLVVHDDGVDIETGRIVVLSDDDNSHNFDHDEQPNNVVEKDDHRNVIRDCDDNNAKVE